VSDDGDFGHRADASDPRYEEAKGAKIQRFARLFDVGVELSGRMLTRAEIRSAGARLTEPAVGRSFLIQTYARDTGAVLTTLSVPLYVEGERYGWLSSAGIPSDCAADLRSRRSGQAACRAAGTWRMCVGSTGSTPRRT
jgi:hypothetical protein